MRSGFPFAIFALLPSSPATLADPFADAAHDGGIITRPDGRHLAIAVFVKDSTAGQRTREAAVATIARVAVDRWSAR